MLNIIRNLVSPKVGAKIRLAGHYHPMAALKLQEIIRSYDLFGLMTVFPHSHAIIELEGSKSKMESLIERLQKTALIAEPVVMNVNWLPYQKQFHMFRVSM